ncbi:NAD(P)-dependent oxidoreductase [Pseudonocardia sp. HH130630-07]|uniref:NAD(P)-dependent oxidoreductase n=1 Tax=Pseudonocardia sp. HH130630-07 TaxID=1690815 RepID=UPI000814ECAC|nr:NAD(P)-binding domain-containing protein [Pseudonocardia sp. HH130630-07]ANY10312.1 oxidoreductase [Pseudonocardia sp. HH130630-07]
MATPQDDAVTVLGTGAMGSAIAGVLLERGHRVTVWNRTASRAAALTGKGARAASSVEAAVSASPLVLVSLLDGAAADGVLARAGAALAGRTLADLTSGAPAQARTRARWADAHGVAYLDGTVLGDPSDVGSPAVTIGVGGAAPVFAAHEAVLRALGSVTHHGADPGAAAVEFHAQVGASYEILVGFLHALRLVRAEGADGVGFAERLGATLAAYPALLTGFAAAVADGRYEPDLGTLDLQEALMDDLVEHRESLGIDAVRMREVRRLMRRRIAQGHGDQGFSGLYEVLEP